MPSIMVERMRPVFIVAPHSGGFLHPRILSLIGTSVQNFRTYFCPLWNGSRPLQTKLLPEVRNLTVGATRDFLRRRRRSGSPSAIDRPNTAYDNGKAW